MKKLQNNFTTLEQSKKLVELGAPADSADCYYIDSMTSFQDKSPHIISPDYKYSDGIPNGYESRFCPCWSVGRLMEIWNICANLMPGMDLEFSPSSNSYIEDLVRDFELAGEDSLIDFSKLEE